MVTPKYVPIADALMHELKISELPRCVDAVCQRQTLRSQKS